jgi:hypothetical protein
MKNLKKLDGVDVNVMDQFIAVMDFLKAMGYDTSKLSVMDAAYLKSDIVRAIENCEDPYAEYMTTKNNDDQVTRW